MVELNGTEDGAAGYLEPYTVVLSLTLLILSAMFGLVGSLILLAAIAVSRATRKLRYCLYASILLADSLFACIWVPMETAQLLRSYVYGIVETDVKITAHSLYLLLLTMNTLSIVLISIKNLTFILYRERRLFRRKVQFFALMAMWGVSVVIAVAYGIVSACNEAWTGRGLLHLMMNTPSFEFKVIVLTCHILALLVMLVGLLATRCLSNLSADAVSDMDSDTQGEMSACLPTIQEPGSCNEETEGENQETEGNISNASSPGINKKCGEDQRSIGSAKREDRSEKGSTEALPPSSKRRSSLQVNLANLLNRRRHTICQIGNTGTSTDPQAKALQYNYVRKFSVDVMALQAQLENPKVHGGNFPFASQQSLGQQSEKGLNGSVVKDSKISLPSIQEVENEGSSEPPANQLPNLTFLSEQFEQRRSSAQRHLEERLRQLRFCSLLVLTYLVCVLPLYVTEVLHGLISLSSYVNTVTCTTAMSLLQIIIYPYLFLCMDSTIHKHTHKLWRDMRHQWRQRREGRKSPVVESTTTETNATQL